MPLIISCHMLSVTLVAFVSLRGLLDIAFFSFFVEAHLTYIFDNIQIFENILKFVYLWLELTSLSRHCKVSIRKRPMLHIVGLLNLAKSLEILSITDMFSFAPVIICPLG